MKTVFFFICLILAPARSFSREHLVTIEGMQFAPAVLRVKLGDKVRWVNKDFFPHTATSLDRSFHSKAIPASGAWTFTPKARGTFPYKCQFHPPMKGTLTVD